MGQFSVEKPVAPGSALSGNQQGEVFAAQGNLAEALKNFRSSHDILERLTQTDAGDAGWRPLNSFSALHDILKRQAKAGWQGDLASSYGRIGDVLVAQGDLAEALKSFRASYEIIDRLAKADAGNVGWQSVLEVAFSRIV